MWAGGRVHPPSRGAPPAAARRSCTVVLTCGMPPPSARSEDRGWLSRGSSIGEHPRGLYGPSALHGVHYLAETTSPDMVIDVRRSRSVRTYYPGDVSAPSVPLSFSLSRV